MKPCPRCGYQNRPGAHRCGLCGEPFVRKVGAVAPSVGDDLPARGESGEEEIRPQKRRDFAAEIRANKLKSAALAGVCLALLMGMGWAVGEWYGVNVIGIALGLLAGVVAVLWALYGGAGSILSISSAHQADPERDKVLINVADEMRIAAGLPMPQVHIIESDAANAFATGRDPQRATVAVTRGLMKLLNREELQGVVAHEMSHVRNFDIRYMMLVAALVGAIVLVSDVAGRSLWWGGGRRRSTREGGGGGGNAIVALLAIVLIIVAPIFATLLQMAISRKREFLADSSAVELTRNPLALASALERIDNSIDREPLIGASRATQHLYIANPLKSFGMRSRALLSTHPPMEARIRILRGMA